MKEHFRQHQPGYNNFVPQVYADGDVMPDTVDSSFDDEPRATEDRRSRDLEKLALVRGFACSGESFASSRVVAILSEMVGVVASSNATSEERQRRGAVSITDDQPGSGAGCPPHLGVALTQRSGGEKTS